MAKKGLGFQGAYTERAIVVGKDGVPWDVDPMTGTVRLATVITEPDEPKKGKKNK